jgi:hypothetical protein
MASKTPQETAAEAVKLARQRINIVYFPTISIDSFYFRPKDLETGLE